MAKRLQLCVKRAVDLVVSLVCLILLLVPLLIIALLIRSDSRGPIFFYQVRPGKGEVLFRIWKFRTMTHDQDRRERQLPPQPKDPRVTKAGRFLRASGIDELPQLINVLLGQMSLVGPRPPLVYRAAEFTTSQKRRFGMKPGITGLALVHGRNNLSWDEKLELDCRYVDQWSLLLDLRILLKTPGVLLRREGVYMIQSGSQGQSEDSEK